MIWIWLFFLFVSVRRCLLNPRCGFFNKRRWNYLRRNAECDFDSEFIPDTLFDEPVDISDINPEDIPDFLNVDVNFFHLLQRLRNIHYWRYIILKARHMDSVLTSEQRERLLGSVLHSLFQRFVSVRKDAHKYLDLMRTIPVLPFSVSTRRGRVSYAFVDYQALEESTHCYPCWYLTEEERKEITRHAAIKESNKQRAARGLRLLKK